MANTGDGGGTAKSNKKKPVTKTTDDYRDSRPAQSTPQSKSPASASSGKNMGHVKRSAVKSAVDTWMRSGMSAADAVGKIREHLGSDFMNSGTAYGEGHRVWPAVVGDNQQYAGGYDDYGGRRGGGGGGGIPIPPPPPGFKIRTTSGNRLTPYWASEPDFIQGWQPRLTVLGNTNAW